MTDQQAPLVGCRVKWDAFTSASGTAIPAGEGTYEGASLCRRDDGSPVQVSPHRFTVLDMPRYRANLDRGREPDEWQAALTGLSPVLKAPDGFEAVGPWEPCQVVAPDGRDPVIMWRRPLRRV